MAAHLVLAASLFFTRSIAAQEPIACPASIAVAETAKEVPGGWQAFADDEIHYLKRIGFFLGHPRGMAEQVPDRDTALRAVWQFPGKQSENYWIVCRYTDTSMTLVRQLPPGRSQCEVILSKGTAKSVTCR
jgi:hypothetical protein